MIVALGKFAAQTLADGRALGFDWDRTNVNGGAIALGHPMGATGTKLTVQILNEMKRRDVNVGLITVCAAGAMGFAMVLER